MAKKSKNNFFVHESSYVDNNVKIGKNTSVWHFSHLQSGSKIGNSCSIGQNVNIGNNVKIGDFVKIQNNVSIYEGIIIEDYVFCGPSMVFTNIIRPRSKYPQRGSEFYTKTIVRTGASIGANATIVCGNNIGKHAFIGAGAVVITNIPDHAIFVGNPAKQIGWCCECGFKLNPDLNCNGCNQKYSLNNKKLKLIK